MVRTFSSILSRLIPLGRKAKDDLERARPLVPEGLFPQIEALVTERRASLSFRKLEWEVPAALSSEPHLGTAVVLSTKDGSLAREVESMGASCASFAEERLFAAVAAKAKDLFPSSIGPELINVDSLKEALSLQLFSQEPVHVLLIGDPGTGKTVLLRSLAELHPISSFGLGSGTSGAGLAVTMKGNEVRPGLLAMADNGLCCIDELNLMDKEDRAPLYSAMEKGFFTYDKAGHHFKFDARIRLIATANPAKTRFLGDTPEKLREQLPFDAALMSRFHLMFLLRKPGKEEFLEIARKIVRSEKAPERPLSIALAKAYVAKANSLSVELPPSLEKEVTSFILAIKEREQEFVAEITPRTVVGLLRLAKASARRELRTTVTKDDLERAKAVLLSSLELHTSGGG